MRNYPQPGERWQHERGWTVTIIRLIEASPSVALVNPEFSCEVLIRHDSDNQLSSCPLAWFEQRYTRLFDAPLFKPSPAPAGGKPAHRRMRSGCHICGQPAQRGAVAAGTLA